MSLLSAADAQAIGIGVDMAAVDLQAIIDREEDELVRQFGPNYDGTAITEQTHGGGRSLYLKRQIASVASVIEYLYLGDAAPTTLIPTDYYVWGQEGRIERVPYGTTARGSWGAVVTVAYIPVDDTARRTAVLIDLLRLTLNRQASGAWSETKTARDVTHTVSGSIGTPAAWEAQRASILSRMGYLSR